MDLFSFDTLYDPAGALKAEIQSRVGEFLQLNAKLRPYVTNGDPIAQQYMQEQQQLEMQLPSMLEMANNLSFGNVLGSDGLAVGSYAARLSRHMSNVNQYLGPAAIVNADDPLGLGITTKTLMIGGGIAVLGMVMGRTMFGIIGGIGFIGASKAGIISVNL